VQVDVVKGLGHEVRKELQEALGFQLLSVVVPGLNARHLTRIARPPSVVRGSENMAAAASWKEAMTTEGGIMNPLRAMRNRDDARASSRGSSYTSLASLFIIIINQCKRTTDVG